jgi:transcriptional regulator with XRE-family HTH domain
MPKVKRRNKNEGLRKLPLPVNKLREFLLDENLCFTQTKLSKAIGVSQPMLSQILRGKRQFRLPKKMLEPPVNDSDRKAKLSWVILGIETLINQAPRAAINLLPDKFVKQNHKAIKECIVGELASQLFPEPPSILCKQ